MGVEDYQKSELFIQELPPRVPSKDRAEKRQSADRVWDVDFALRGLLIEFRDPMLRHERVLRSCASFVRKQAIGRWQLGYKAKIDYLPDHDALISFPFVRDLAKNNRYRHSLEVAKTLVRLGKGGNLGKEDLFLLAIAGLVHDFEHPVFSHLGENFFREAASFAQKNDPELASLLEKKG